MGIPTIDPRSSLTFIRAEGVHTQTRASVHPKTAPLAPAFALFLTEWTSVAEQERALEDTVLSCQARTGACDDNLDMFVDDVEHAVLLETKNVRTAPLYQQYFGKKRKGELKKPVLGEQLEIVRGWIVPLKASPNPMLADLGAQGELKVAAADKAVADKAAAEQALHVFRTTGARRQLVDKLNALRKSTHGEIAKLPHEPGVQGLPRDFADRFFRHESRPAAPTMDELREQIAATKANLAELEHTLAKREAEEAEQAKAEAERAANDAAIAEAEKAAAEAKARAKELRAGSPGRRRGR